MRSCLAVMALCLFPSTVALAEVKLPPTTQPKGEPLWLPGTPLPKRPATERTLFGHLAAPVPPRIPPTTFHRLYRENVNPSLPDSPYWRGFLPYDQLNLAWGGRHRFAVGGVESPDSAEWSGP